MPDPQVGARTSPDALELSGTLLARNAFRNLVGQGLPLLVAIAAIPTVLEGLGPDRFGVLAIAWVVLGYFSELGFGRSTTRFAAEALATQGAARLPEVFWTTAALQGAFGVVGLISLWIATPLLTTVVLRVPPELLAESRSAFRIMAVAVPVVLLTSALRGVLEAAQRFDLVNRIRIPASTANYLLPLVGVLLGWRLPGILGLLVLSRAAAAVGYFFLGVRLFPSLRRPRWAGKSGARPLLAFGGWTKISTVVSPLLVYLDRVMVGMLVTMAAVAVYAVPFELVMRLLIVPASVAGALFPAFSTLSGETVAVAGDLVSRSARYVIALMAPFVVLLVVGAEVIMELWLGAELGVELAAETALVLRILAAGVFVNALAQIAFSFVQGVGRADLTAKFHLIELPVHVVVAYALIQALGVPGAALAWTLRVVLDAVLLFGAVVRISRRTIPELFGARVRWTAIVVVATCAMGWIGLAALDTSSARIGLLTLMVALATLGTWHVGLDPSDRQGVRRVTGLRREAHEA